MALNMNSSFNPNDISWMDSGADPSERGTIAKAMRFIFGASKGFVGGVAEGEFERAAEKNFKHIGDANKEISDITSAASDALSEFGKNLSDAKAAAKQLGLSYTEGLSSVLPGGIYRRLSRAFEEPETETRSQSDSYEDRMNSEIAGIFSTQSKIASMQHSASMKSAATDRALAAKYQHQNISMMALSNKSVAHIDAFLSTTYTNYLKKDLELKYRSYRVMSLMKGQINTIADAFGKEGSMTQLANTLGPKEDNGERGTRQVSTTYGYSKDIYKTIFNNMLEAPNNMLQTGAAIMQMLAANPVMGIQGVMNLAGRWGGKKVMDFVTKRLSEKNQKRVNTYRRTLDEVLSAMSGDWDYFSKNKSAAINSLGMNLRGSDNAILRFIGGAIPGFERSSNVGNKVVEDPKGPAVFDNITRETIISVIPRHLERIGDIFEAFARKHDVTYDENNRKVYDFRSRSLITRNEQRNRNIDTIYGRKEDRQERFYSTINTFMNLTQYLDQDQQQVEAMSSIEENKQGLHLFIMRSARANLLVNEQALLKVANGGYLTGTEEDYVKATLGSPSHAQSKNTARAILLLITRRDKNGRPRGIDHNLKRIINNKISEMSQDVDQSDQYRANLEDLNMFDPEDYIYDTVTGESRINERSRMTQYNKDSTDIDQMGFDAGVADERIVRDRAKFQERLDKIKGKSSKRNMLKWARALNSNFISFFGGGVLDEVSDWLSLANAGASDLGESIGNSKIAGWVGKKVGGGKNKVTRVAAVRDPKDEDKKDTDISAHVIFRVSGLTAISKYKMSFSLSVEDLKYTVGEVAMAAMQSDKVPNKTLDKIVKDILSKIGKDKYEAEYSADFFRRLDEDEGLDYDVGPGPSPTGPSGSAGAKPNSFLQHWKKATASERQRIKDLSSKYTIAVETGVKNYLDKVDRHSVQEYLASIDRNLMHVTQQLLPESEAKKITSVLGRITKIGRAKEEEAKRKKALEEAARLKKVQSVELDPFLTPGMLDRLKRESEQAKAAATGRLTSTGKQMIMKEEERYSSEPMTDNELKEARKWFEQKTKAAEKRGDTAYAQHLAQITIDFENAVSAGDWMAARQLADQQASSLVNYQYTTAMTQAEIKKGTSVYSDRVEAEYNKALTPHQLETLHKKYQKRAESGRQEDIDSLEAFRVLVQKQDWKKIREANHINRQLDEYKKYKAAVEEGRWEDARRMTGVLRESASDDIGLYNTILSMWTKTTSKNREIVKVYPFDQEYNGYISITLNNALAMLRNIEPGHKEVTKALTRILQAFGTKETSAAERTKNMLEVLDSIATDKTLYRLRNGEDYTETTEYDAGISLEDESLIEKDEAQVDTNTSSNPVYAELKGMYEAYKEAGVDIPEVGKILNNLEGVKHTPEVGRILKKVREVFISLGDSDIEVPNPDVTSKDKTIKQKFGEYLERLSGAKIMIDKNLYGKSAAARVVPGMQTAASDFISKMLNKGKSRSKINALNILKDATQKFADEKARIAAEEEAKKQQAETNTTTTSSGYADGTYATLHADGDASIEVTNLGDPNDRKKRNAETSSFFGRMFGIFNPILKKFKKVSQVDDSAQVLRTAVRAGLSFNTAAILSFMSSIGRKIDQTSLSVAAAGGYKSPGIMGALDRTLSEAFLRGVKKVKDWTADKINKIIGKLIPIPTFDYSTMFGWLGRGAKGLWTKLFGHAAGGAAGGGGMLGMSRIAGLLRGGGAVAKLPPGVGTMSVNGSSIVNAPLRLTTSAPSLTVNGSLSTAANKSLINAADDVIDVAWRDLSTSARLGAPKPVPLLDAAPPPGTVFGEGFSAAPGFNAPIVSNGGSNLAVYHASKAPFDWSRIFNMRNLATGAGGLAGGLMGSFGSKSSGAGGLSQFVSGTAGGIAGGAATSALMGGGAAGLAGLGPVGWAALAVLAGNAMREGWNDNKSLAKTWGSASGLMDYQKGASAVGNLANYLTFGLLNKTRARKWVDKAAMYSGLGHLTGAVGGALAGWGDIAKSTGLSDDSDAMSEEELKQARARLQTNIKRGTPNAQERLQQFEEAVQDKNWYRARDISGIHINNDEQLRRGAKRVFKNGLAIGTMGLSSVMEWGYDTFIGNNDKPMSKEEVAKALKNFAVLEKKDPSYKSKRLDFEEAIAGERWAIARKLSGIEDQGWLGKKFGKAGGVIATTGLAPYVWLFGNNENEPMSDKEIKDFTKKCNDQIRKGNQTVALLLDRFETAVAKGDWALARKLAGKETSSIFSKLVSGFGTVARYTPGIGMFFWDSSSPMSKEEIHNFRKKMEYLISKGNPQASRQLEKFEAAVLRNDWETARRISKVEARSVVGRSLSWTWDVLVGSGDRPMSAAEIEKFRDSMKRKIEMGDTGAKVLLERFDDAVGQQKWDLARKLSGTRAKGLIEKTLGLGVKVGKFLSDPFDFLGIPSDSKPMSEKEISSVRNRLQKLIDTNGNPDAKNLLDQFNDAVADGSWRKARRISGMGNSGGLLTTAAKYVMLGSVDRYQEDEKDKAAGAHAERYRMIADRVKEAISKKEAAVNKTNNRKDLESLIGLRSLQKDMKATDVLELDDEILDKWEARLRQFDSSVGLMEAEDISEYEATRKEKIKLIAQKNALLSEITAAQERCGFFEWSKKSALKQLFTEVNDLTIDELDQDLIDGYDEDLRMIDSKAITTKNLSESDRKKMMEVNKRKNALLGNIERAIDGTSFYRLPTILALKRLRSEVESALPEELTDEMFEAWDMDLKELDPTAHDSKQRSQEELLAIKEMNRKRIVLVNAIKKSIENCSFYEVFKKNNLNALLKEVESTPDEDLTAELLQEWELDLKDLDENALSIEEEDAEEKAHKQLLRDKRKLRVKLRVTSKQYKRKKDTSTAKALQKIVDTLDSIDDDEFTRDEYKDALQDFTEIDQEASADLNKAEVDRQEAEKQAAEQDQATMSSGKNEQAVSLDKHGKIVDYQEGSPTSVSLKTVPGGSIIHTHTDGSHTSATDIASALKTGQTSVTTLRSGKVLGYSGQNVNDILRETISIQQQQAQQNSAEMHSALSDLAGAVRKGASDTIGAFSGNRDVLTGIYERLGDVIETIAEHNGVVNDKIVASATQSYDLARNFTLSRMKQKAKSVVSVFKPSVINISK